MSEEVEVKEEKATRFRAKDGKFVPPIKKIESEPKWWDKLPNVNQSTKL